MVTATTAIDTTPTRRTGTIVRFILISSLSLAISQSIGVNDAVIGNLGCSYPSSDATIGVLQNWAAIDG
jgi:hypothetical protein